MSGRYNSVVLYTGGIDSFILLAYVRKRIDPDTKPVYFALNGRYERQEIVNVEDTPGTICDDQMLDLGCMETKSAFIPNRNILLTVAAVSKYSYNVYIGGSKSDRISDNNKEVFDNLSDLLTKADGRGNIVTITSPFWDVYKDDMVNWYIENVQDGRSRLLNETFSCYDPLEDLREVPVFISGTGSGIDYESRHCFLCPACFRRNAVLNNTGYILPFYDDKIIEKYYAEFKSTIALNPYDRRAAATLQYINQRERHADLKG